MQYILQAPQRLRTTVKLPASKSISNRALIIHALAGGTKTLRNLSDCDDTRVLIGALTEMPEVVDIGAAGTAMRFMAAYLAATPNYKLPKSDESLSTFLLTGTERMKHRPIGVLVNALRRLGADITYAGEDGFPPLRICGKQLEGGRLEMPGNVSSQYISALLMIGPTLKKGLQLKLTGNIVSRPYIDLTLHVMRQFGCNIAWTDESTISVAPQAYKDVDYEIENDWSAASYWYEMMALSDDREGEVTLPGLYDNSYQGDSVVRQLFEGLGVKTNEETGERENGRTGERESEETRLTHHERSLTRMEYDFVDQPDLAQTLVVTCCALGVKFHFTGLASLKIKETDRIEALKKELRKVGFVIYDRNDAELIWDGERCEPEATPVIDTYEDHRMAMAFAPLAITLDEIRINNPQVVSKSYPKFWNELEEAGFGIVKDE